LNSSNVTFNATAGTISSDQNATITASYNGNSANASVNLMAPVLVSSLACAPSSLGPNSASTCTVTLTKVAPTGGASVALSDNTTGLTTPPSVSVVGGATVATFSVTTAAISSDQSATVTATYNGSSANANVSLVAPVLVSSLTCTPSSLGPNASSTCTVTLTKAAPSGGANIALSDNNTVLTTPASVSVAAGATSAIFSATTAAIASSQSATVTATYNGSSANANVSLVAAPVTMSSLACTPSSLGPNASSTCTVTLTNPAPKGGASVALSDNNTVLTTPTSVSVPAGATTATFSATTAAISSSQSATVTATYNGSSANTTVNLVAASVLVSSLACTPNSLGPNASSTCTVTLTKAAPTGGASVAVADNRSSLTTPASVSVAAGTTSASFSATTGNLTSDQTATITATYSGSSANASISLVSGKHKGPGTSSVRRGPRGTAAPASDQNAAISITACTTAGASSTCRISLSLPAPAGGTTAKVESSSDRLRTPASVIIPEGQTDAEFTIETLVSDHDELASLRVFTSDASAVKSIPIRGVRPVSLLCRENLLPGGGSTICEVQLDAGAPTGQVELGISTSSTGLKVPRSVVPRRGQSSVLFEVLADQFARSGSVELAVRIGTISVQRSMLILPAKSPALQVPSTQTVVAGTAVRFSVAAADGTDLPLNVVASDLPEGASFDTLTGSFEWRPSDRQNGSHTITFTAMNSLGAATSRTTTIEVGPEAPVLVDLVNSATRSPGPACVPGAMATLRGRWLSDAAVRINATYADVLNSSSHSVDFICPASTPGTQLEIIVETRQGASNPVQTTMQEAAPGIVTLEASPRSPAFMQFSSGSGMVGIPNHLHASQVALPGDSVTLWVTGVNCSEKTQMPRASIIVGGNSVAAASFSAVPERPGTCALEMRLPETLTSGDAIPLSLDLIGGSGQVFRSNTASVAVGQNRSQ
jgi:hypothetical protein